LLTSAGGQCIRFAVTDVRVFQGRTSMGVRGIALGEGDKVISLSILRHVDASAEERDAYLRMRQAVTGDEAREADDEDDKPVTATLAPERYAAMSAAEEFVLTLSEKGFGKRTSSYRYRITGRGGKGIVAMVIRDKRDGPIRERIGRLIASFPVEEQDQIMLVTDGGQLIRCPVDGIRVAGRSTQGVIVFSTADGERVVSVERLSEEGEENGG
jgi:DNA gyrase subunit A